MANCTSPKMRARSLHGLEVTILLRDVTKVTGVHLEDVTKVFTGDVVEEVVVEFGLGSTAGPPPASKLETSRQVFTPNPGWP